MILKIYQFIRDVFFPGMHCRFYPTCSHYACEAVQKHGWFKGTWLAVVRLSKCHPWHAGGNDPVP